MLQIFYILLTMNVSFNACLEKKWPVSFSHIDSYSTDLDMSSLTTLITLKKRSEKSAPCWGLCVIN